jgi:aryl carrier-like protein
LLHVRAVWGDLLADATDQQDIAAASARLPRGLLAVLQALSITELQLTNVQDLVPAQLDDSAKAALRRTQERARVASMDIVQLLMAGDIQQWEQLITVSFQQGMSLHLEVSTIKQQVGLRECPVSVLQELVYPLCTNSFHSQARW